MRAPTQIQREHGTHPRRFARVLTVFVGAVFTAACGAARLMPAEPRGALRIVASPSDARVEIDETRLGVAGMFEEQGVLLRPGEHRLILRAEGFFPEYRIVEIKANEALVLKVELREVPP